MVDTAVVGRLNLGPLDQDWTPGDMIVYRLPMSPEEKADYELQRKLARMLAWLYQRADSWGNGPRPADADVEPYEYHLRRWWAKNGPDHPRNPYRRVNAPNDDKPPVDRPGGAIRSDRTTTHPDQFRARVTPKPTRSQARTAALRREINARPRAEFPSRSKRARHAEYVKRKRNARAAAAAPIKEPRTGD